MALGGFHIRSGGTWEAPGTNQGPDSTAPALVTYPQTQELSIAGRACRGVGSPFAEVGRKTITQAGVNWYVAHLEGNLHGNDVDVCLFDPYRGSWVLYQAVMNRPVPGAGRAGATILYTQFRVRFTELRFLGLDV